MAFRKLWFRTGAKSDSGFSVQFRGLHDLLYREGDKLLVAFRERLTGDPSVDIDSASIESWEPPHQDEIIFSDKKRQILENILAALDFLGITYIVR
jgi:hypothetical protein